MKKYLVLLLLIVLQPCLYAEELSVDLSAASFKLDDDHSRWELYYSFPENSIKYISFEDRYVATLNFSIEIKSTVKTELEDNWSINHFVTEPPDSFKLRLFGLRAFKLQTGQYKVKLTMVDNNDEANSKTVEFPIIIRKIRPDKLEISDIMLSNLILNESNAGEFANQLFWKNSLYVYPNPSAEVHGDSPMLQLYSEIYNAKSISPDGLTVHYHIYDGASREVLYFPRNRKSEDDGIVEFIKIPLDALPTGVYNLVLAAKSVKSNDSVSVSKRFYLFNPHIPPSLNINFTESMKFETSEFATLSEDRIEREFRQVRMIADKAELEQFRLLSDYKAKARFIFKFWEKRNNDTLSPINMALFEHRKKIDYANIFYSYGSSDNGWDSDRGHVLLKYGEPTRRDFTPQRGNERPYESWFFAEIEGGVYFYFVDVGGFGNYQLVHSTKSGEFYNQNWYELFVPISKDNRDQYRMSDEDRRYR